MATIIAKSKRDLFTIDVSRATPVSTKYNIPSTFEEAKKTKKKSNLFGKSTREEYNSYLNVNNTKTPTPTEYNPETPDTFGPAPVVKAKVDKIYRPNVKVKLSNQSKAARWSEKETVKNPIGPGTYDAKKEDRCRSHAFEKTARKFLASNTNTNIGPGSYNPISNSKGIKPIGEYSYKSVDDLLNTSSGFRPKGFGRVPRWDEQKQTRFAVADKFMKEMMKKEKKEEEVKLAEERRKLHGTFGTGPQFTLFNAATGKPGPGAYNPTSPPLKKTCNIKLGFKLTVAGGIGAEGANIASFENQRELINRELIEKTGIESVDKEMKNYRKAVDRKVKQMKEADEVSQESQFDLSEKELNKKLFALSSNTPKVLG